MEAFATSVMSTQTPHEPSGHRQPVQKQAPTSGSDLATALSWSGSILLHIVVIVLAFAITWVVVSQSEEPPRVISSALEDSVQESIQPLTTNVQSMASDSTTPRQQPNQVSAEDLAALTLHADSLLTEAATLNATGFTDSIAMLPEVRFGGVRAPEARRIVFVVDASGSMIGAFPTVLQQLERSLSALSPKQRFGIVLFQESGAIEVPPTSRLHSAQQSDIQRSIDWIAEEVVPRGRSNPTAALRRAFNLDPDVIFVISTDITGSGEFEIDKQELLDTLDELNPTRSSGTRAVRIRCIQLLEEDPLGTLKAIATEHGGVEGYAFIDRGQIGLDDSR